MYDDLSDTYDSESEGDEPQNEDWVTTDHVKFYETPRGKHVLTLQFKARGRTRDAKSGEVSDREMWKQIHAEMKRQNWFPNVWFISDHGNAHLMEPEKVVCRTRKTKSR